MLIPLDLKRYGRWSVERLYKLLFPYLKRDFMGREDCRMVHVEGNINAPPTGGPVTYTAARGGQGTLLEIKAAQYRAEVEAGTIALEIDQETGEFSGV